MKPDHLSISQMRMLDRCGQQWSYRYGEGLKLPPGLAMVRGRAVDHSVTTNMEQKIETAADLPVEQVVQDAVDTFEEEAQTGICVADGGYTDLGWGKGRELAKEETIDLAKLHAQKVAPIIQPTAVQKRLERPFAYGVSFVGIVDVIEEGTLRDTKTTARKPTDDSADKSDQLTGYDWLYRKTYDTPPKKLTLDQLVRRASGSMDVYIQESRTRTLEELNAFEARARRALQAIKAEIFLPAAEDAWCCNAKWCGYHEDAGGPCPFSRGRVRPAA